MTTNIAPTASESRPPTEEEQTREVKHATAADLIERGLQSRFGELFHVLLQIMDSDLIDKEDDFRRTVRRFYEEGDALSSRIFRLFPVSDCGGASHLRKKCRTLTEEVDLFRQEHFWLRSGGESLVESEALIRDLYKYYADVEYLMREIDQDQPDYRVESRCLAPKRTPNPYEAIDHD